MLKTVSFEIDRLERTKALARPRRPHAPNTCGCPGSFTELKNPAAETTAPLCFDGWGQGNSARGGRFRLVPALMSLTTSLCETAMKRPKARLAVLHSLCGAFIEIIFDVCGCLAHVSHGKTCFISRARKIVIISVEPGPYLRGFL